MPTNDDHEFAEEGVGASTVDLLRCAGAPVEELEAEAVAAMADESDAEMADESDAGSCS